ncbi:MAG: L,D-transpeptidase [Bdellovibrionota bacterium]
MVQIKSKSNLLIALFLFGSGISAVHAEEVVPAVPPVKPIFLEALPDSSDKVKFKVVVQLAGEGKTGSTTILKKKVDDEGNYTWSRIDKCQSSNGFETRTTGDRAFKTPAGRFQPLDTSNKLLYQGSWDSHGPATYYFVLQATADANKRGFAAIHNGHVSGRNSHGCVRTENDCAREVLTLNDLAEEIPVEAEQAVPQSLVFSSIEENLFGRSLGIRAKTRLDYSAMVLEFLKYEGTDFE